MRPTSLRTNRLARAFTASLALGAAAATWAAVTCHIHPPGSTPERPRGLVGPFASARVCEAERQRLFGGAGRCHCVADFAPEWLPPPAPERPGESPLG
jgi:hypothetical protein